MPATPFQTKERNQNFLFGSTVWQEVDRFDNCNAHTAILRAVQGVQGVDFVALTRGAASTKLSLIEVKDYRDSNIPSHKAIAKELAEKVLGTICGATVAARAKQAGLSWNSVAKQLAKPTQRIRVFLHIESSTWQSKQEADVELAILSEVLQKELAWLLDCDVVACSEQTNQIPDCVVQTGP